MNNKAVLFGIDYSSSYNLLNAQKSHTSEIYTMKHFLENKLNFKNVEIFTDISHTKEVSGRYIIEKLSLIMIYDDEQLLYNI